jgi:phosphohistidine phosphatase SixA
VLASPSGPPASPDGLAEFSSLSAVPVHLVRHACAGDKTDWAGPDLDRPLDPAGLAQAAALADDLGAEPIGRIVTSPARRCSESIEPLALRLGLAIEIDPALLPDGNAEYLRGLLPAVEASSAVVCVHGEQMRPLLAVIRQSGARIVAEQDDDDWLLMKGTAWDLTLDSGGAIVGLRHRVPQPVTVCSTHDPVTS